MKTFLITFLTLTSTILMAQNTVTWVGGTAGNETSWEEPKNWSNYRVPNEFSDVVIPDVSSSSFSYPEIKQGIAELNSLRLAPSANLIIQKSAQLIIYGPTEGGFKNNLKVEGSFIVYDEVGEQSIISSTAFSKN